MARGYNSMADRLILADDTDVNKIYAKLNETLNLANTQRTALVNLRSYRPTDATATILRPPSGLVEMEEASEYGVPQSLCVPAEVTSLGFDSRWYDIASRFT